MFVLLETRLINFRNFSYLEVSGINCPAYLHKHHLCKDRSVRQKPKTDVLHFCLYSPAAEHSWVPIAIYLHHYFVCCEIACQGAFAAWCASLRVRVVRGPGPWCYYGNGFDVSDSGISVVPSLCFWICLAWVHFY